MLSVDAGLDYILDGSQLDSVDIIDYAIPIKLLSYITLNP